MNFFWPGFAGWTVDTGIIANDTCLAGIDGARGSAAASFCGLRIYLAVRHPISGALQGSFSNRRGVDPRQQTARPQQNKGQS